MNKVLHKIGWGTDTKPAHLEPTLIPLNKETSNGKSYEYYVKLKLSRDPTYSMSELYELRMFLFENGMPEEFLLFVLVSILLLRPQERWIWT